MQLERGNTHTDDSGKDKAPEESLEVIKLNSTAIVKKDLNHGDSNLNRQ